MIIRIKNYFGENLLFMILYYKLNKPIAFIYNYLTDMQKFASVHPIISKIEKTNENTYLAHETLQVGFFPFSFTYPVHIQGDESTRCITMKAKVFGIVEIEMIFRLFETLGQNPHEESITKIEETIKFKSLFPIAPFVKSVFRTQHKKLFQNIEAA